MPRSQGCSRTGRRARMASLTPSSQLRFPQELDRDPVTKLSMTRRYDDAHAAGPRAVMPNRQADDTVPVCGDELAAQPVAVSWSVWRRGNRARSAVRRRRGARGVAERAWLDRLRLQVPRAGGPSRRSRYLRGDAGPAAKPPGAEPRVRFWLGLVAGGRSWRAASLGSPDRATGRSKAKSLPWVAHWRAAR